MDVERYDEAEELLSECRAGLGDGEETATLLAQLDEQLGRLRALRAMDE